LWGREGANCENARRERKGIGKRAGESGPFGKRDRNEDARLKEDAS